jgi:acetyl esterase
MHGPIDEQAAAVLSDMAAQAWPDLRAIPITEARRLDAAVIRRYAAEPRAMARVWDTAAAGVGGDVALRVFVPRGTPHGDRPRPLVLYLHGGGWVVGSVDTSDPHARLLADEGDCVVVSAAYRLAPEHPFPNGLADAYSALVWAYAHASALGADRACLALVGDSAGANLVGALAKLVRDVGGPAIAHQTLIYPPTDAAMRHDSVGELDGGFGFSAQEMAWYWEVYTADGRHALSPYVSLLDDVDLRGLPPALVVTAELDPLRDEGEAYAARMHDAGSPARVSRAAGQIHGFWGFAGWIDAAQEITGEIADAIRGRRRRSGCAG